MSKGHLVDEFHLYLIILYKDKIAKLLNGIHKENVYEYVDES